MKLIIMSCSATKRATPGLMPAIDRYDGPLWRTLRARLAELPDAEAAVTAGTLRILLLSAEHGFIAATDEIADYENRMTVDRSAEIIRRYRDADNIALPLIDAAENILFVGGALYRDTMWRASGAGLWHIMKIDETEGGIGQHRADLSHWLRQHYGAKERRAAA